MSTLGPPAPRREPAPLSDPEPVVSDDTAAAAMSGLFGRGLLYVVAAALPFLTALVISPVLAHVLGPSQFGLLASAIAVHQVLVVLPMIGLDQAIILQRAEDGHDRSARGLLAFGIVLVSVVTTIVGVTIPWWGPALGFEAAGSLLVAAVMWTVPAVTVQLVVAVLMSNDRLRAYTLVSTLSTVGSQLVGVVFLFSLNEDVATYAWGGALGQVVAMAVALSLVRPVWRALRDRLLLRRSVVLGMPLLLSGLSTVVLNAGDRLVVQTLLGSAEAGRYQVAYTVGAMSITLLVITAQAWAARIAELRDDEHRWAVIGRSRDALYRALAPAVLGVVLAAPLALRLLAPDSFRPSGLVVVVLLVVLSGIPVVAGLASGRALITLRRSRPLAVAAALAAVLNVGLNFAVVPHFGLTGAAAATVAAFTLQSLVLHRALPATPSWPRTPSRTVALLAVACALAAASTALPQDTFWITVRTVLAVACLPWLLTSLGHARSGRTRRFRSRSGRHATATDGRRSNRGLPPRHRA